MPRRKIDMEAVRRIDAEAKALAESYPNMRPMGEDDLEAALDPAPGVRQEAFSTVEAAKIIGLHPERLRQLVRAGELPAARMGKSWRISRVALETYFQACGGGRLFPAEETKENT